MIASLNQKRMVASSASWFHGIPRVRYAALGLTRVMSAGQILAPEAQHP